MSASAENPRRCAECRAPEGRLVHRAKMNRRVWVETMKDGAGATRYYDAAAAVVLEADGVCRDCRKPPAPLAPGDFW